MPAIALGVALGAATFALTTSLFTIQWLGNHLPLLVSLGLIIGILCRRLNHCLAHRRARRAKATP